MRRPLTVRWWFRVGLVVFLVLCGYVTAYASLREYSEFMMGVAFDYPCGIRMYADREAGCDVVGIRCEDYEHRDPDSVSSTWIDDDEDFYRCGQFVWCDSTRWYAPAIRLFYPAERIELWWRGQPVKLGDPDEWRSPP